MATALIAEDEPLLAAELREELLQAWPGLEIVAQAGDGHRALQAIEQHRPEVLFLDVQLPGLTGLELASLSAGSAHIVFITAYGQHALQAFDAGAVDYLVKPLERVRLVRAVQRVQARLAQGQRPADVSAVARQAVAPAEPMRWISVLQGREIRLITVDEICYFRADHKYVAVVTADAEAYISTPLRELLQRLDPACFWQVHRGTIVNLHAVRCLNKDGDGRLSLHLKQRPETLMVGTAYASRFR